MKLDPVGLGIAWTRLVSIVEEVATVLADVWRKRDDNYSERRSSATSGLEKVEMSYIGG